MGERRRAWVSWSSGKDSTMAFAAARQNSEIDVVGLLVTMNASADRVAMHAVRHALVEIQAERLGLPLTVIEIPEQCSNETYELKMTHAIDAALGDGVECFVFGDLFLEDVRRYRETQLHGTGITPIFPLWGLPTDAFAQTVVASGVQAVITCVDPQQLSPSFIGRRFDTALLNELPSALTIVGNEVSSMPSPLTAPASPLPSTSESVKSWNETASSSATCCRPDRSQR